MITFFITLFIIALEVNEEGGRLFFFKEGEALKLTLGALLVDATIVIGFLATNNLLLCDAG